MFDDLDIDSFDDSSSLAEADIVGSDLDVVDFDNDNGRGPVANSKGTNAQVRAGSPERIPLRLVIVAVHTHAGVCWDGQRETPS